MFTSAGHRHGSVRGDSGTASQGLARLLADASVDAVDVRTSLGDYCSEHSPNFRERIIMHARFLGVDPGSQEGQSPTLFATDRRDRKTYIAQGWVVTDPQALADVGPVPDGEAVVEIPADVLEFYVRDREMR